MKPAMTLIEIPVEQANALIAKANAQGLNLKDWLGKLAEVEAGPRAKPLKSAFGLLAEFGPLRPPRRSTRIAATCSAASVKIIR